MLVFFLGYVSCSYMICINLSVKVVAWGSTALSDMLLTSMLGGSLLSFFWGYVGRKLTPAKHEWGYPVSAIFMGLACLSKGPIGIAFPVSISCNLHPLGNRCPAWYS